MESTSPNTLTFVCPSCHASLTVPGYLAGIKGPCPRCRAEITAPSEGQLVHAHQPSAIPAAAEAVATTTSDIPGFPTQPLPADTPPQTNGFPSTDSPPPSAAAAIVDPQLPPANASQTVEEPVSLGVPIETTAALVQIPLGEEKKSRRGGLSPRLMLIVGLLAIGSAVIAALILWPKDQTSDQTSPPLPQASIPEPRATLPAPTQPVTPTTPVDTPVNTPVDTAKTPSPPEPPATATATPPAPANTATHTKGAEAARETLDAFLAATTLEERMLHVQTPDAVRSTAKSYYDKHPLGLDNATVEFKLSSTVPNSDREFHIFQITTPQHEDGFPVSVEETGDGMKVDWTSFVEFHDNALGKFINIYHREPASFHCIVERAHYFRTDVPDLGSKICLRVQPPIPGYEGYAFIDNASPLAKLAEEKFAWDHVYFPVLKLQWTRTKDGHQYIEVLEIVQDNWRAIP